VTQQPGQWCHLLKSLAAMYGWRALRLTTDMIPRVFLLHVSLRDLEHTITTCNLQVNRKCGDSFVSLAE
jgi:hypothetical protein